MEGERGWPFASVVPFATTSGGWSTFEGRRSGLAREASSLFGEVCRERFGGETFSSVTASSYMPYLHVANSSIKIAEVKYNKNYNEKSPQRTVVFVIVVLVIRVLVRFNKYHVQCDLALLKTQWKYSITH